MREIVGAEYDAPPGAIRRVQLLTQPGPRVAIAIDTPTPDQAGPGRTYKLTALPTNAVIKVYLQANQAMYAATMPGEGGMSEFGYICEFFDETPVL